MEILNFDLSILFTLENLIAILIGTLVGLIIGALPGLGAAMAIILLLPFTFEMAPIASILLLLAAYQAAEYGGSISSVILGIPGTPGAIVTTLDGYPLAQKGYPGKALGHSLTASAIGGLAGGLVLLFLTGPISKVALQMTATHFFLIGILGLFAVASLSSKSITKSLIAVVLGLMLGTVGQDLFTGASRFTFGRQELLEGVDIITLLVGMFAFSELFIMISENLKKKYEISQKKMKTLLSFREVSTVKKPLAIGSAIGAIIGIIPGLGPTTAAWFSYSASRKVSKEPETFGQGNPEGIAAAESANNSSVGAAMIPVIALGIPGTPAMAIVIGAFILHGIRPGPEIFSQNLDLVYGILIGFLFTSISMYLLGLYITNMFARVLTIPTYYLIPTILVFSIIGVYVSTHLHFNLWLAVIIGIISLIMKKLDFSLASLILGFILAPIIEENFRRALTISNGDFLVFFEDIFSIFIWIFIGLIFVLKFFQNSITRKTVKNN